MNRLTIAMLALVCFTAAAPAKIKGCYERKFDPAHLAEHLYQATGFMQVQVGLGGATEEDSDTLMVLRKGGRDRFYAGFQCTGSGKTLKCRTDGGTTGGREADFTLTETAEGLRLGNPGRIDLLVEGSQDLIMIIDAAVDNKTFDLKKVNGGNCR